MNYITEINKIIQALGIDIEEQVKAEEMGGPFDEEWVKSHQLKLQVKEDLQDIIDRLEYTGRSISPLEE